MTASNRYRCRSSSDADEAAPRFARPSPESGASRSPLQMARSLRFAAFRAGVRRLFARAPRKARASLVSGPGETRRRRGTRHAPARREARIVSLCPALRSSSAIWDSRRNSWGEPASAFHPRGRSPDPKVGGTKDVDLDKLRALQATHVILNVDENREEDARDRRVRSRADRHHRSRRRQLLSTG